MAYLYRVTLSGICAGVPVNNVLYFESETRDAAALVNNFDSHFLDPMRTVQAPAVSYGSISAYEVGHLILDHDQSSKLVTKAGSHLGDDHSDPQLAVCFQLRTAFGGRHRRGRFFMPGLPDEGVQDGRITGAYPAYLSTLIDTWRANWITDGGIYGAKLVVFSRSIYEGLTDIILDSYKPVTTMAFSGVMSTMRTRKPVG